MVASEGLLSNLQNILKEANWLWRSLTESREGVKHGWVSGAHSLHISEVVMHVVDPVAGDDAVGFSRLLPMHGHARVGHFLKDHFQRLTWYCTKEAKMRLINLHLYSIHMHYLIMLAYPPHPSSQPLWFQDPIPPGWWLVMTPDIGWMVANLGWWTGWLRGLWFSVELWGWIPWHYRYEVGVRFRSQETLRWWIAWAEDAKSIVLMWSWCYVRQW